MKRIALLVAVAAAFCPLLVFAGTTLPSAPPPPDMDAKGVETPAAPVAEGETASPAMPDTRLVRDKASRSNDRSAAQIEAAADSVTERKEGNDTVREYREKGKLRMVRIVPKSGPAQTYYDRNGDGRLNKDSFEGPVSPVYFTLYEWD